MGSQREIEKTGILVQTFKKLLENLEKLLKIWVKNCI